MSEPMDSMPIEILLVEDSATDALLTTEALKEASIPTQLHLVVDGVEAMAFLRREGRFKDAPRPHLTLLDWNLPRKSGREVLREMKDDDGLKEIPVIVFSTSRAGADIDDSYRLHANSYVTKPVGFDAYTDAMRAIGEFWFRTAALPQTVD